jgi:voltage-gated sodium channel
MERLASTCRRLVEGASFQRGVLALIAASALLTGLETSRELALRHAPLFAALGALLQAAFLSEIALRLIAHWPRPLRFFRDGWNSFDFAVVAASLLPQSGGFLAVARLARVLRAARLVSALPELRLVVGTMLRSIPSLGHVTALLALLLYVYGVIGVHAFGAVDPGRWGSLVLAIESLFQVLTLEGWVEMQAAVRPAAAWAPLFFASFIIVAVFVVINLFIAVVTNNLDVVRREENLREGDGLTDPGLPALLRELKQRLDEAERTLGRRAA